MKLLLPKNSGAKKQEGTDYVFITDLSGSMWGSIDALKDTLRATKKLLSKKDTISLGWFSSYGEYDWILKGASLEGRDINEVVDKNIYARGLTCYTQILQSLNKTVKDVRALTGNKHTCLFFLSDGMPNDRSYTKDIFDICTSLKGTVTAAKIVGYGSYYNREILLGMADRLGGTMNHVTDFAQLSKNYSDFVGVKKESVRVPLSEKYDLVWQVSDEIALLSQNPDNSVDVQQTDDTNVIFAMNMDEINGLKQKDLKEGRFVYSLAYILSQRNKANLGVKILKLAQDHGAAQMLQKAFTTLRKGVAENFLKDQALTFGDTVNATKSKPLVPLATFLNDLMSKEVYLDLKNSKYRSITRKHDALNLVETERMDDMVKITDLVTNENRPNISFQTVQRIRITEINDTDLKKRVTDYNKKNKTKPIKLPIEATTFKNYTLVANGDFNFEVLTLVIDGVSKTFRPDEEIEIFDGEDRQMKVVDFAQSMKTLIKQKAVSSVLKFLIQQKSDSVHSEDLREKLYSPDAVEILKDLGLDYQMRYAAKSEYKSKDENADYVPFLAITGQIKGASTINAKDCWEKIQNGKSNAATLITQPIFAKYGAYEKTFKDKGKLLEVLQGELKTNVQTVRAISSELAKDKFYLMSTNSWFDDCEKKDELLVEDLVIKVKEEKEYL